MTDRTNALAAPKMENYLEVETAEIRLEVNDVLNVLPGAALPFVSIRGVELLPIDSCEGSLLSSLDGPLSSVIVFPSRSENVKAEIGFCNKIVCTEF